MRKSLAVLLLVGTVFFAGCSNPVELSGDESDALSDYMASIVLKHAENYETNLYTLEEIAEIEAKTVEREQKFADAKGAVKPSVPETQVVDNKDTKASAKADNAGKEVNVNVDKDKSAAANNTSITNTIGKSNFNITYKGFELASTYNQKAGGLQVDASQNKQLLIIKFAIKNSSDKKEVLDLVEEAIQYKLKPKSGADIYPMMTLLLNDIQYFNMSIDGGATQEAVILFEVDKNVDINGANLSITRSNSSSVIEIK